MSAATLSLPRTIGGRLLLGAVAVVAAVAFWTGVGASGS